jgi:hypothetical protein
MHHLADPRLSALSPDQDNPDDDDCDSMSDTDSDGEGHFQNMTKMIALIEWIQPMKWRQTEYKLVIQDCFAISSSTYYQV